jgi:uncharacterized phiE125 gp8 family phage protein
MTSAFRRDAWSLEVATPPALEPLALEEAKKHVRVEPDFTEDDDYLRGLLLAVKDWAEGETSKALLTQTLILHLDRFPYGRRVYLPRPPLQSVTGITYLDTTNTLQTLPVAQYQVVGARVTPDAHAPCGYILPAYGTWWPVTYPVTECVQITYVAGWTTVEAVPQRIKQAMLIMLGDLYENRERIVTGATVEKLDLIELMLANERCYQEFSYG